MNEVSGVGQSGEVFLLVLRGQMVFTSEGYVPVVLVQGDSVYFDTSSPYRLMGGSADGAELLKIRVGTGAYCR